jgi:predicted P-loop ATPase
LPYDLRDYYNDRINFKNENDLNLGLTSFGLINLDEFDKITQRQQIVLKYLVSTADLKYRPPYGKAYSEHRRFASFIGTTNEMMPLTDPSGGRRFVCVMVKDDIDFLRLSTISSCMPSCYRKSMMANVIGQRVNKSSS